MIKKYIKKWFHLYEIKDLTVGSNCGCCGRWMPKEIVAGWRWSLCKKCEEGGNSVNTKK